MLSLKSKAKLVTKGVYWGELAYRNRTGSYCTCDLMQTEQALTVTGRVKQNWV